MTDREKLIDIINTASEGYAENLMQPYGAEVLADYLIANGARISPWISAEDNPPKYWRADDEERTLINYLVYSPDYGVDVGNYVKPAKQWLCMGLPMNVTHWMPMPETPKEAKDANE